MPRSARTSRFIGCAIGLVTFVAAAMVGPASSTLAADPAFAGMEGWGWVVARRPAAASYTPSSRNQKASFGTSSTVTRLAVGMYVVRFTGFWTPTVDVHVSALGDGPTLCTAADWGPDGSDTVVEVTCFDRFGLPADSRFTVNVLAFSTLADDLGYVLALQPTTTTYQPVDQYNSSQASNTVHRTAKGRWTVTFPGLGGLKARGSVVATAAGASPGVCRVTGWSAGLKAQVECRNRAGSLADRAFDVAFMRNRGLKSPSDGGWAYLRSDHPALAHSAPATGFWSSSSGSRPAIDHPTIGVYQVTLGGLGAGGSAQVSAYGSGDRRCNIGSIRTSGSPQRVTVRCYLANGAGPADASFTLAYTN